MNSEPTHDDHFDAGKLVYPLEASNTEKFVHVPLDWVKAAQETKGQFAVTVALLVWYKKCVTRSSQFPVSNSAALLFGLNRKQKASGLKSLQKAGLISISTEAGSSPVVSVNF